VDLGDDVVAGVQRLRTVVEGALSVT